MTFELKFTLEAQQQLDALSNAKKLVAQFKAVKKALNFLKDNPAHPSLHMHKYESLVGPEDTEVFEAYAQNKTPGAYRIFWCYYPPKKVDKAKQKQATHSKSTLAGAEEAQPGTITVISITPHP